MKRFAHGNTEIWIGLHPMMGILIYDPRAQVAVAEDKVRLYVWSRHRMATFLKSIVRERLVQGDSESEEMGPFNEAAEFYRSLRGRFTHCYKCKLDLNSIDFELCKDCRWIKCECSACGCDYQGSS